MPQQLFGIREIDTAEELARIARDARVRPLMHARPLLEELHYNLIEFRAKLHHATFHTA